MDNWRAFQIAIGMLFGYETNPEPSRLTFKATRTSHHSHVNPWVKSLEKKRSASIQKFTKSLLQILSIWWCCSNTCKPTRCMQFPAGGNDRTRLHTISRLFCLPCQYVTQSKAQTPCAGALILRLNPHFSTIQSHNPRKKTDLLRKLFYNYLQSLFKFLLGIFLLFLNGVYDAWVRSSLPLEQPVDLQTSTKAPIASSVYKKSSH